MQLFEALFLILLAIAIVRIILGPRYAWLTYSRISIAGLAVLMAGLVMHGWRWQLLPAGIAFALVVLGTLKRSDTRFGWRVLGAVPLILLVGCSAVLAGLMPVVSLPTPAGPYGVGTFDLSVTDHSRVERYSPGRKRELYVEVWYPAAVASMEKYPVRTLFHDLYEGKFNQTSLIFGYLKQVDTHSHVKAPAATPTEGAFPVLLFNHALDFGFTSQNLLLMEHLASHGYVIVSIAHPYQTAKVNLAGAGTILRANGSPADIVLPRPEMSKGIVSTIFEETKDIRQVSRLKAQLFPMAEQFVALDEAGKAGFVRQAMKSPGLKPFERYVSEALLEDFFYYDYVAENSLVQYWVQDNQFIADVLSDLHAPIAGFSGILDLERLAVIGMSYGGAAAGEFCKIDIRCKAGVNLDGTQFGQHWNRKVPVPFLMFYNDQHQGGNDYAYSPPAADFWDLRVEGATHMDFTDFAYLWPILKFVGFSGRIDGMRMMQILDSVELDFFDHYLKGKPVRGVMNTGFPEIVVRRLP
jgi:predicted dienelactone hydrolase